MKKFLDFSHFRGDFFGGVTAGIVALPLALAFGVTSGLGPSAGLYGAIFISFFAALFGGTPTQISGPTAPMTAVSLVVVSTLLATFNGEIEKALPYILLVFLLAGVIQIILGFTGLGKYIKYIPYPVVSGFMTAIGVIILITQILPVLGYSPADDADYVNGFKAQAEQVLISEVVEDVTGDEGLALEHLPSVESRMEAIKEEHIMEEATNLAVNEAKGVAGTIKVLPRAFKQINWLEFALAMSTILIIYGFKKITTAVPSTLVALFVVSGVAVGFGLPYVTIQEIPSGFPIFHLEIFSHLNISSIAPFFVTAISLALLGSIDSLLTSVVADNMTKTRHNPNQEMIGQGIGNSISSLFGGIPGAGATIRTVVNINAGGKTKLSGMVAGILLLVILLGLGPIASKIPAAVLAGILVTVGIGVMDYKGLRAIPKLPKDSKFLGIPVSSEVIIMLVVMLLSVFWDLVSAVAIGLIISALIFMKRMGDMTAESYKITSLEDPHPEIPWVDEETLPERFKEEIFIKHIEGPIFFGSTSEIQNVVNQVPESAEFVVFRMDKVPYMDQSGLYALEDAMMSLVNQNVQPLIVGLSEQPRYMMESIDIIPDLIKKEYIFKDFDECVKWIVEHVNGNK